MNRKDLSLFLILQLLAIAVAGLSFALIQSRLLAGGIAGFYFLFSGLYMTVKVWRWKDKWQTTMFYPLLVHVFVISLPMIVTRFLNMGTGFTRVRILGLPGPVFHQMSSLVFVILLVATLIDWVRLWRTERAVR